jgi:NAD(P)-dependent dehydrogenase (short-subunit alcohol dehydrogenase family)
MRSASPRRAPTSSASTRSPTSGPSATRWPRRTTWTVKLVEALDRRILVSEVDVRDGAAVKQAVDDGVAQLGRLDAVVANAGIASFAPAEEMSQQMWDDMIDINLSGVFRSVQPCIPHLRNNADGGAIVLISSVAGLRGVPNIVHYSAAKHGLVGMMKTLAMELAPHKIRVNTVHPTNVDTPMIQNEFTRAVFFPDGPLHDHQGGGGACVRADQPVADRLGSSPRRSARPSSS